ncbi:MAG: hypothetical protein IPF98_13065 [Gemmatimonadetes bacterium]|nr:hypothetical protein [Gemmatimonadota bacterium]
MNIWPGKTTASSTSPAPPPAFPGVVEAMDGSAAIVEMETAASEAAGAYPITPSTQMGEGWAAAVADGRQNVNGRRLLFFEPEGEHAAAAVTAGMSMMGLRATNFSSGQGIAYARVPVRGGGKAPDVCAQRRGARHDQAGAQRARRAR